MNALQSTQIDALQTRIAEGLKCGELITASGQVCTVRPLDAPLRHIFTPGLYTREIFMPKGSLIVSRIHNTTHTFVVSKGHAAVLVDGVVEHIKAPYTGITKPGTRRVLFIHEDCIWTTFHAGNWEGMSPDEIVAAVTEKQLPIDVSNSEVAQLTKGVA